MTNEGSFNRSECSLCESGNEMVRAAYLGDAKLAYERAAQRPRRGWDAAGRTKRRGTAVFVVASAKDIKYIERLTSNKRSLVAVVEGPVP